MRQLLCFLSCRANDLYTQLEKVLPGALVWTGKQARHALIRVPRVWQGQPDPIVVTMPSVTAADTCLLPRLLAGAPSQITWLVSGCCFPLFGSFRKPAGDASRLSKKALQHSSQSLLCSNRRSVMVCCTELITLVSISTGL